MSPSSTSLHSLVECVSGSICNARWLSRNSVVYPWLEQNCGFSYFIGVHPWLCLVAEGGQNRHIPGCSTKCSEGLDGSVRSELSRAEERIETRLFWVRILYFRHISISQASLRPRQFMMRETCGFRGMFFAG